MKNPAAIVLAVAYFVMVWIGKSEHQELLHAHIVTMVKRIFGATEFFYCALADGIQRLLTRHRQWETKLDLKKTLVKPSPQLESPPSWMAAVSAVRQNRIHRRDKSVQKPAAINADIYGDSVIIANYKKT